MMAEDMRVVGDVDDAKLVVARARDIDHLVEESSIIFGGWPYFIDGMSLTS